MKKKTIVISLGGSVVVPEKINVPFLKDFVSLIKLSLSSFSFIIVVGGVSVCRMYNTGAKELGVTDPEDLDKMGIRTTHVNAELIRSIFSADAYKDIITNPTKKIRTKKSILVAGGWKPGRSTDDDAVHLAHLYGAGTVINITNTDYLYNKNPATNKDAQKIEHASWKTLQSLVGTEWKPGMNVPFDPVATKLASELKLKLIIIGPDVQNLRNVLENKKFKGSVVE